MEIISVTKIVVTQADIDEGKKDSDTYCPIALACRRTFPGRTPRVAVYINHVGDSIKLYGGTNVLVFSLGSDAHEFINRFDAGQSVKPATFLTKFVARA
jgi:hypothetical protein